MNIISHSLKKSIGPNVKVLSIPLGIILVITLLFISLIRIGYSRITAQIQEYKRASDMQAVLNEKVNVLRQVSTGLPDADSTVVAMPGKNPGATAISQVRAIAQENSVVLSELQVSGVAGEESIQKSKMGVEIQAQDYRSLIIFLQDLLDIAPVSTVEAVSAIRDENADTLNGSLLMNFYWSALPTSLPPINETVGELSVEERDILSKIGRLRIPSFTQLKPASPAERSTPFN